MDWINLNCTHCIYTWRWLLEAQFRSWVQACLWKMFSQGPACAFSFQLFFPCKLKGGLHIIHRKPLLWHWIWIVPQHESGHLSLSTPLSWIPCLPWPWPGTRKGVFVWREEGEGGAGERDPWRLIERFQPSNEHDFMQRVILSSIPEAFLSIRVQLCTLTAL